MTNLPGEALARPLDEGTAPDWFLPWGWNTRALLAYRAGDAKSAQGYVAKSEASQPSDLAHTLNLTVLAMAQTQLESPEPARRTLDEAAKLFSRYRTDPRHIGNHDLLIISILIREAEARLNGESLPKPVVAEPAPSRTDFQLMEYSRRAALPQSASGGAVSP